MVSSCTDMTSKTLTPTNTLAMICAVCVSAMRSLEQTNGVLTRYAPRRPDRLSVFRCLVLFNDGASPSYSLLP